MTVKVNGNKSTPRLVQGGSPQGSLLGNSLFCIVTEQLNRSVAQTNEQFQPDQTPSFGSNGDDASIDTEASETGMISPIARPNVLDLTDSDSEEEILASNFIYFNPKNRIHDTELELSARADQSEIDREFGLPQGWKSAPITIKVYIDDLNSVEKITQENAISHITENKRVLRVHSPKTESLFERIYEKAEDIKMRVNQGKTQLLCISASVHDDVLSYIRPCVGGGQVESLSTDSLKIVGFTFERSPSVRLHIKLMCENFRAKLWSLRKLRRAGMGSDDLLVIYKASLRPIIEFACVTYGPMLTSEMSESIESLQLRSMKIVYGTRVSYRTVIDQTGLKTLEQRRYERIVKFAQKTANSPLFKERWFPKNRPLLHNLRETKTYLEEHARTDRLYKSPLFTMRRIMNTI